MLLAPSAAQAAPTWTPIASGTASNITGIEYQSASRFWFVTDAGDIFTRQASGAFARRGGEAGAPLNRIAFQPGGNVGIATGPNGDVFRSADGGQTWARVGGLGGKNAGCNANEPLTKAFSVRWAGNDVVYILGGNKILRSQNAGTNGSWDDANALSPTACKADFADAESLGVSDAFFAAGNPNRGWLIGSSFGEIYSALDTTASNTFVRSQSGSVNGFQHPKRLVGDPAQPGRQWAIAPEESGNTSYIKRTSDGWASVGDFGFPGGFRQRSAPQDVGFAGGTLIIAGSAGQIENSIDGVNLYLGPAGGALAQQNWRAVDLASGTQATVGGNGGALAVTNNANSVGSSQGPGPTPVKPKVKFRKGGGIGKPKYGRDRKGRRTVTIKISGRLGVPAGVSRSAACRGNLTATFNHKRKRKYRSIGVVRKLKVSSRTCAYKKTVRFQRKKVKGRLLRVVLEFPGNTAVARTTYRKTLKLKR